MVAGYTVDGANSNFVINETDTFTNTTEDLMTVSVERFRFHASRVGDPVTPFLVRVNGDNNFTVVAIGNTVTSYVLGNNDVPFSAAQTRLLVAPGGFTPILFGKLMARFAVGVVQMIVLLGWGHWMFRVSLGSSPVAFVLLTVASVFAVVAAGMLVAGITRTREQVLPVGLSMVMALSALGGCWWPQSMQPDWMSRIAPAVFTTWSMRGLNDLILREGGLAAIVLPAAVLVGYGTLTMLAGISLFRARHSAR